ncbi:restriction endonuclease [Pantoea deleyi]|uniref:Restriction endonuclease n=1 Tax=Pantoea deleyi TaxID=470932 RepID=A0A506QVJ0_9GAMM|nr:restriction endonuclease [Pantoea deleyi]ORM84298.1 restriction endonuclease [Pantoea deleyi]TPV49646.1 restriction endonuclease [Pantoea deleyi]
MPVSVIAELIRAHPVRVAVALALALFLVCLLSLLGIRSASGRRHRRYQKRAASALARLPQLRDDAARMVWLRKMNPYVFEEMLLTALSRQGFRIKRNARYSGDGGMDGQVWIAGQRWLIQAKRYGASINARHIAAFGELVRDEACRGLFIHTGRTGEVSREAFRCYPDVTLISGQRLLQLLNADRRWLDFHSNACQLLSQPSLTRSRSLIR